MKRTVTVVVALLLVAAFCTSAFSASVVKTGAKRLVIAGAGGNTEEEEDGWKYNVNSASVLAKFGYFVSDPMEVGITAVGIYLKPQDEKHTRELLAMIHAAYHFNTSGTVMPYVGAQCGVMCYNYQTWRYDYEESWYSENHQATTHAWGGFAGVDFLIGENAIFFVEYNCLRMKPQGVDVRTNLFFAGLGLLW